MATAFGDIITYKKNGYIGIIKYKDNESGIIGKSILLFFRLLEDSGFRKINLEIIKNRHNINFLSLIC